MINMFFNMRHLFLAAAVALLWAMPANSQENKLGMTHVFITYRCKPADRPAMIAGMEKEGVKKFEEYKKNGIIADYLLVYNSICDENTWDMSAVLQFDTYEQTDRWRELERTNPGGLSAELLKTITPATTYFSDRKWFQGKRGDQKNAIYVMIPYQWVDRSGYTAYIATYGVPQFDGWLKEGVLNSYGIFLNHHATGAPWDAYLLFEYKDAAALGNREMVKQKVRAALKDNVAWKLIQESKQTYRTEHEVVMAKAFTAKQ
jgi:hypothetical protein